MRQEEKDDMRQKILAIGISDVWLDKLKRLAGSRQSKTGQLWSIRDVAEWAFDRALSKELAELDPVDANH